jgi:hypothetical protein
MPKAFPAWNPPQEADLDITPREIALIQHFRDHLAVLSDPVLLDLLCIASVDSITNASARKVLGLRRSQAWTNLSALVKVGMLEKRGQFYRASPYARHLISALYIAFRNVLGGTVPQAEDLEATVKVLKMAADGLESLYDRGRMDPEEYRKNKSLLKEFALSLEMKPVGSEG